MGAMLIVVEPTSASARTATRIAGLAKGLGLNVLGVVLNKARFEEAKDKVTPYLDGLEIVAVLPADPAVAESEVVPEAGAYVEAVEELRKRLDG